MAGDTRRYCFDMFGGKKIEDGTGRDGKIMKIIVSWTGRDGTVQWPFCFMTGRDGI